MSKVKQISKKYEVKESEVNELKKLIGKNLGYLPKFSEFVFEQGSSLKEIKNILSLLKEVKINKPINEFPNSEKLYDYLTETFNKRKLNQVIKSIPSKSRRNVSDRVREAVYNNIEKESELKDFFSKKGGRCKNEEDLYKEVKRIVSSNLATSYNSILRKIWYNLIINLGGGKIVYKDGDIIILKVNRFSLSKKLGSSHWCISKQKSYWKMYNDPKDKNSQYFIWDTTYDSMDKKSMLGVTISKDGSIRASHFKDDSKCDTLKIIEYYKYITGNELKLNTIKSLHQNNIYSKSLFYKSDWKESLNLINNNVIYNNYRFNWDYFSSMRGSIFSISSEYIYNFLNREVYEVNINRRKLIDFINEDYFKELIKTRSHFLETVFSNILYHPDLDLIFKKYPNSGINHIFLKSYIEYLFKKYGIRHHYVIQNTQSIYRYGTYMFPNYLSQCEINRKVEDLIDESLLFIENRLKSFNFFPTNYSKEDKSLYLYNNFVKEQLGETH